MYHVDAEARPAGIDPEAIGRRRQEHTAPVLAEIETLLTTNLHAVLPSSLLGKALHYLASQWSKLVRFVDDGHYPLGKVEMWRGGRRSRLSVGRPFRLAVPEYPCRSSVSTSLSSNRTCGFPASGSLPMHQAFAFERLRSIGRRHISPNVS